MVRREVMLDMSCMDWI